MFGGMDQLHVSQYGIVQPDLIIPWDLQYGFSDSFL